MVDTIYHDIYHYHESQPLGSARVGEVFFAEPSELRGPGGRAGKTGPKSRN